eukprot:CAMPEP_0178921898 /NCGR_PEP_ID=MMETSP0786-20121207/15826_1 /TAXON_ID=186022 /ORGANISM="Thalassionema frauenfeldii, Strain CCMP 1798" /LENGTH=670 /DNA_ID=CAMNT_0020596147 /DNA_START=131 /DNA_END=2143 /DNA_ORIENTATION=+
MIFRNVAVFTLLLVQSSFGFVVVRQQQVSSSQQQQQQQQPNKVLLRPLNAIESPPEPPQLKKQDNNEKEEDVLEGLPWWWEYIWELDFMKPSAEADSEIQFGDSAYVFKSNIEQIYGGYDSLDHCPMAEGALDDLADGTMFIGLQKYYEQYGSPYKLCFGPKSFLVLSDPIQFKHVLREQNVNYDKGVLAEILEPIMGKGLIPADPETWTVRRRQIAPAFHKAWLDHMVGLFGHCNQPLLTSLDSIAAAVEGGKVEMEEKFCSVALDIIGKSIFNYDFGSVTRESPVIKAVYSTLVEAEHRSMTPAPYWNLPFANQLVPRLRKFNADIGLLNEVLDELITKAKSNRREEDIESLESRDYNNVSDPSMLRFLVDLKGADLDNKQLRDDLMTMLIAGHETTAAVLTWALYELVRHPECLKKAQDEIDRVFQGDDDDRLPTYEDVQQLEYIRLVCSESLRLYPEPPLLIRRCRTPNDLPRACGTSKEENNDNDNNESPLPHVIRGMDLFLATYSLHRDERFWPNANDFDPERFLRPYSNPEEVPEWAGFDPSKWRTTLLYPNEFASDYAYLPFGAGQRKCVGDQFAMLEATVTLAMILRRYNFEFDFDAAAAAAAGDNNNAKAGDNNNNNNNSMDRYFSVPTYNLDHPVGMRTGATIHTRYGLHMKISKRNKK